MAILTGAWSDSGPTMVTEAAESAASPCNPAAEQCGIDIVDDTVCGAPGAGETRVCAVAGEICKRDSGDAVCQTLLQANAPARFLAAFGIPFGAAFPGSPSAGDVFIITDDSAVGACDSAAGAAMTMCRYSGAAWVALGTVETNNLEALATGIASGEVPLGSGANVATYTDLSTAMSTRTANKATLLAANGANCGAGNYPLGVDDAGAVETCTADDDVPDAGEVNDTALAAGAVDGGNLGEIADNTIHADDMGVDSVSAAELNATGVETELEAELDLDQLQGAVTDAQIPDTHGHTDGSLALADIANISTDRLLGREAAGAGVIEQLTLGPSCALASTQLNVLGVDSNPADTDLEFTCNISGGVGLCPAADGPCCCVIDETDGSHNFCVSDSGALVPQAAADGDRSVDLQQNTTTINEPTSSRCRYGFIGTTPSYRCNGGAATSLSTSNPSLNDLSNVTESSPANGATLIHNAGLWEDGQLDLGDGDAVTGALPTTRVATALKTDVCDFAVEAPVAGDDGDIHCYIPDAATLIRVYCSTDTSTSEINLYERAEGTPNTGTTDMLTADLVCDTDGQATTTFSDAAIAADAILALSLVDVFTTGWVRVHVEYTLN